MANTPQIASLQKNHPQEYAKIAKDIADAKSKGAKSEELLALANAKITPIALKAIKTTSDAALLDFGQTKIKMLRDIAAKNTGDCVQFMSGEAQNATPAVAARILSHVSDETKTAARKAIGRVIEDEGQWRYVQENADARLEKTYKVIDDKLKRAGTSVYYFMDDTKSSDVRCRAGIGIFSEVMSLPAQDRSFMLRSLFGAD